MGFILDLSGDDQQFLTPEMYQTDLVLALLLPLLPFLLDFIDLLFPGAKYWRITITKGVDMEYSGETIENPNIPESFISHVPELSEFLISFVK